MTVYAVVENQQVIEIHHSLPINWRNTSGFYNIGDDVETLKSFGWYIVDVIVPEYNSDTQELGDILTPTYDLATDKVSASYNVIDIQRESPIELQRRFLILVRDTRNDLLSQSDWTMLYDNIKNKTTEWINAWESYRQQLREYPSQFAFGPNDMPPDFNSLVWPEKPSG